MLHTDLYILLHIPIQFFSKSAVLIYIHSIFTLFNVHPFMSLIPLGGKNWFLTLAFLSQFLSVILTLSLQISKKQLMRCMRKMSAYILILKSKAIEMSSERFRSVKCNENIFVWKCHNQHSCTLRTAWAKTEGLVRCKALQHQSFLLHMTLTDFLRSLNEKCVSWNLTGSNHTAKVHSGAVSFIFETNWLNSLIIR